MHPQEKTFIFAGYSADLSKGEILFHYRIEDGEDVVKFIEKVSLPAIDSNISPNLLSNILNNISLALGINYWKMYCPKKIILENIELTGDQVEFWNTLYTKGLGELFYKNNIDYRGLVSFPYTQTTSSPVEISVSDRSLLPLGGGKDSIVSAQLLKAHKKEFDLLVFSLSQNISSIQKEVAKVMGKDPLIITRTLDPKLLELNKVGKVYKGHVPVSAIYAFLSILVACLYDYKYIIVSNEKSANYGNVEYLEGEMNHQWSKSLEFEMLFRNYVSQYITPSIEYFSLLRGFSELKIAQVFSKYPQYFSSFSSCNRNFRINGGTLSGNWCGECAKCAFVFALLSAFLSKQQLISIFGKNLYSDEKLMPVFKELLGISGIKPFDCVGTPDEMKLAMSYALQKGEYKGDVVMEMFEEKNMSVPQEKEKVNSDTIPQAFKEVASL